MILGIFIIAAAVFGMSTALAAEIPSDFILDDALKHYNIESASLLKRSMLTAGFSVEETIEINDAYLDFASQALLAEMVRVEKRRDALLERKRMGAGDAQTQTCSAEDGDCKDTAAGGVSSKKVTNKLSDEFGHFLTPDLKSGQADNLKWEDGVIVQDYAARVGLPPHFIPTFTQYAKDIGLYDIMMNMLYENPLSPGGSEWFSFQSPYQKKVEGEEMRNFTWNVERPDKKWKSDMHWFNTADELSHEDALRALSKGGFDQVLKGIGEKFNLDELHVDSIGFVAVTNCARGFIHTDWEGTGGRAFNFLVGIHSPEDAGPELIVESDERGKGEVYYGRNAGILVGDETRHGTRECDHSANQGVRITASIYLADVTKENVGILAGDTTSIFPPMEEYGESWIFSQQGRHWRKEGGGPGLVGDPGRASFQFKDNARGCTKNDCYDEGDKQRNDCLKTCQVFIDDEIYKPGTSRSEVLGY